MTNQEKAEYEARAYRRRLEYDTTLCNDDLNAASVEVYNRCLEMAEWKDQNPSDKTIMLILNCIGYEEESWLDFVKNELKKRK